jgi:hypothetical protein
VKLFRPVISIPAWIVASLVAFPLLASAAEKSSSEQEQQVSQEALEFILDQTLQAGWQRFGLYALVSTVVTFLLLWPASKWVVGTHGTLKRNASYIVQVTIIGTLFLAVFVVCIRAGWILAFVLGSLVYLYVILNFAKRVFETSNLRAVGTGICYCILTMVGDFAAQLVTGAMPWAEFGAKTPEEQKEAIAKWQTEIQNKQKASAAAAQSAPAAAAPAGSLQDMYANLQKTRAGLDMNDPAAVAAFNEQVAAYNAAKAAAPATPATVVGTPKTSKASKEPTPGKKKADAKKRD